MELPDGYWIFHHAQDPGVITEFALALAAEHVDGTFFPCGTAVVVAPGLAMAAKHVFHEYWARFGVEQGAGQERVANFHIHAFQVRDEGREQKVWDVTRVWSSATTDIIFLKLESKEVDDDHKWRTVQVSLVPPDVGSRILCFGYHDPTIIVTTTTEEGIVLSREVDWADIPATSSGKVVEIFAEHRDRGMYNFPCFQVNAPFRGGMSGGPVFNEQGKLCGLVCGTLKFPDDDENTEPVSYVATLWPSMAVMIDMEVGGYWPDHPFPILDLAHENIMPTSHWEQVQIDSSANPPRAILLPE